MQETVKIRDLNHSGEGVGLLGKKVCFIPGLLPGEEALIEVTENKKNYARGRVKEILHFSEHRREAPCAYQGDCGGCPLMPLEYKEQFLWKKSFSERTMKKIAGLDISYDDLIEADKRLYYRNKLTLFMDQGRVGLKRQASSQVIPIKECMVADKAFASFLPILEGRKGFFSLVLRKADEGVMVILQGEKLEKDERFYDELEKAGAESIYFCKQKKEARSLSGDLHRLRGEKTLPYHVMGREFSLTPRSFFQIHKDQARKLYELVKDYADLKKEDRVLDLYSGQGTLGAYLSPEAGEVLGVELIEEAVYYGSQRIPSTMKLLQGRVEDMELAQVDLVILDPPRGGLEEGLIKKLLAMKPERIIYVSCNPVTQARDLKKLLSSYKITRAGLLDLFPHTTHVESIILLQKNKA
ncbi:MAG TPA: class I SAM-dependent RNA methyltransferase [Clostridia bacterium]|nr:class I SAM-dependent RNA methyltransferase [Clostridia bacterium]